jgi:hypothetical protein
MLFYSCLTHVVTQCMYLIGLLFEITRCISYAEGSSSARAGFPMLSWSFRKTAAPSTIHNKNIVSTFSGEPDSQACGPQRPIQRFPPRLFATTERLQTKMRYTIAVLQPRLNMAWTGTSSKRSGTHPEGNAGGSLLLNEPGSLWCLATGWTTGQSTTDPGRGERIFALASGSRPALGPTHPPDQWVPGILSPGLKRGRGVTLTTHPHLVPGTRMRSYTSSPPQAPSWRVVGQL